MQMSITRENPEKISKLVPGIQNGRFWTQNCITYAAWCVFVLHIVLIMILPRKRRAQSVEEEEMNSENRTAIKQKVFVLLNLFSRLPSTECFYCEKSRGREIVTLFLAEFVSCSCCSPAFRFGHKLLWIVSWWSFTSCCLITSKSCKWCNKQKFLMKIGWLMFVIISNCCLLMQMDNIRLIISTFRRKHIC